MLCRKPSRLHHTLDTCPPDYGDSYAEADEQANEDADAEVESMV